MVKWKMEDLSNEQRQRVATAINNATTSRSTKQKCNGQVALVHPIEDKKGLVHIDCPILVRIIRKYSGRYREYDGDNYSGGAKGLRDAIASTLGLKGDSKADGITFEYAQERSEKTKTVIEIFSKKK